MRNPVEGRWRYSARRFGEVPENMITNTHTHTHITRNKMLGYAKVSCQGEEGVTVPLGLVGVVLAISVRGR